MRRHHLLEKVSFEGFVAVVREESADSGWDVARTFAENGVRIIEVTMTTPDALAIIARLRDRYASKGLVIAAGTTLSERDAALAAQAGAEIIVSPHTDRKVIEYALAQDLLSVAGAATATEIITAWEARAGLIKVYPVRYLGGPDYIRTIRQPIRGIPMLAGGPVDIAEIPEYLAAGCIAVNVGASIAPPDLVAAHDWDEIGHKVDEVLSFVKQRQQLLAVEGIR